MHVFSVGGVIRPSFNSLEYLRSIVFSFMNDVFIKPYHFVQIFNLVKHLIAKHGLRVTTTEVQNFQKAVLVGKCISLRNFHQGDKLLFSLNGNMLLKKICCFS